MMFCVPVITAMIDRWDNRDDGRNASACAGHSARSKRSQLALREVAPRSKISSQPRVAIVAHAEHTPYCHTPGKERRRCRHHIHPGRGKSGAGCIWQLDGPRGDMALRLLETPCPWRMCFASLALQMTRDVASWKSRLRSPWSCRRRVHASYGLLGSISLGSHFLVAHARSRSSGRDERCGHDVHEPHAGGGTSMR